MLVFTEHFNTCTVSFLLEKCKVFLVTSVRRW